MSRLAAVRKTGSKGRNCGDCYWFNQQFEGQTCSDVGQTEDSEACEGFEYNQPNAWLENLPAIVRLSGMLQNRKDLKVSRNLRLEVEDMESVFRNIEIPSVVKTPAQGRKLQKAVSEAVAYRARLTEVLNVFSRLRGGLMIERIKAETEVLSLNPVKMLKTKNEKDVIVVAACVKVDTRIIKVDGLADSCREMIKACDSITKAADVMLRAIYATKDVT